MKDIAKLIVNLEIAGIGYTFDGRRLETDGVVLFVDDQGRIELARRKRGNPPKHSTGLVNGDARERDVYARY